MPTEQGPSTIAIAIVATLGFLPFVGVAVANTVLAFRGSPPLSQLIQVHIRRYPLIAAGLSGFIGALVGHIFWATGDNPPKNLVRFLVLPIAVAVTPFIAILGGASLVVIAEAGRWAKNRISPSSNGRPFGSYRWVADTGGSLTTGNRIRMAGPMVTWTTSYVVSQAALRLGRGPSNRGVDVRIYAPPATRLASAATTMCSRQPEAVVRHSYRTWMYGKALAELDGCELDDDLFYCAALLHDCGLVSPSSSHDFTYHSARAAMVCGIRARLDSTKRWQLANGICAHPNIGASPRREGVIACYVQWGAMADLAAIRRWELGRENIDLITRRYRYEPGDKESLIQMIETEARVFSSGRFSFYVHLFMPTLLRLAA